MRVPLAVLFFALVFLPHAVEARGKPPQVFRDGALVEAGIAPQRVDGLELKSGEAQVLGNGDGGGSLNYAKAGRVVVTVGLRWREQGDPESVVKNSLLLPGYPNGAPGDWYHPKQQVSVAASSQTPDIGPARIGAIARQIGERVARRAMPWPQVLSDLGRLPREFGGYVLYSAKPVLSEQAGLANRIEFVYMRPSAGGARRQAVEVRITYSPRGERRRAREGDWQAGPRDGLRSLKGQERTVSPSHYLTSRIRGDLGSARHFRSEAQVDSAREIATQLRKLCTNIALLRKNFAGDAPTPAPVETKQQDPLVGRWSIQRGGQPTKFVLTARADKTWSITTDGREGDVSGGTWRTEAGAYKLLSGKADRNPATARILADGSLQIDDGGERMKAVKQVERKPSALGLPPEPERAEPDKDSPGEDPFAESFGEGEGLTDPPFPTKPKAWVPPSGPYRNRHAAHSGATGARKRYADAVESALRWLAAHQSPDGRWEAAGFGAWCDGKPAQGTKPGGAGQAAYDPGVTGLALCAFLGAGYTNRGKHPYAKVVQKGLRYLKNIQDPKGCFGPRSPTTSVHNHAAAALAMVEAYGITASPIFKASAQRALDFIAMARNPYFAWSQGVKSGLNDTSVSTAMLMVLKSAHRINAHALARGKPAPLTLDEGAFEGMRTWLDKVTDRDYGTVGYSVRGVDNSRPPELMTRFPPDMTRAMTAAGVLSRIFMGEEPRKSRLVQLGADECLRHAPRWNTADGSIDMEYWHYGTLAMFQVGGKHWDAWEKSMVKAMLASQRKDTDPCRYQGSWDPAGVWGQFGGRVYSTAIMALCCEVFYRYEREFGGR